MISKKKCEENEADSVMFGSSAILNEGNAGRVCDVRRETNTKQQTFIHLLKGGEGGSSSAKQTQDGVREKNSHNANVPTNRDKRSYICGVSCRRSMVSLQRIAIH